MALYRTGLYVKNHSVEKVQVAKTPIASYNGNVTGLYIPELIAYITAKQSGSGTPSPDNIRPISGVSECNVVRCGKNILKTNGLTFANPSSTATANTTPRTWNRDSYCVGISHNNYYNTAPIDEYSVSDNEVVVKSKNATYGVNIPITLARNISGKITLNANVTGGNINVGFYKEDGTFISSNESSILPRTVSIPSGTLWAVLSFVPTTSQTPSVEVSFTDIMIELSDTSSSYEAYNGNTYTIQLGDTYYGGVLNVTTGLLTVTKIYKQIPPQNLGISVSTITYVSGDMKSGNALAGICDTFKTVNSSGSYGVRFGSNNNTIYFYNLMNNIPEITNLDTAKQWFTEHPVHVCYELRTPITVQLTPTQIEQLLGTNNVWADTGNVEVKFYNVVR